jgi:hypothetical protein
MRHFHAVDVIYLWVRFELIERDRPFRLPWLPTDLAHSHTKLHAARHPSENVDTTKLL